MNITEHWLHQIKTLAYDSSEPMIVKGLTKLRIGHRFRIPGEDWLQGCSHDLVDLSYSSNESKIKHLERNYFDKDRYDMFLEKLDLRSDMGASILTYDFGHKPKRAITLFHRSSKVKSYSMWTLRLALLIAKACSLSCYFNSCRLRMSWTLWSTVHMTTGDIRCSTVSVTMLAYRLAMKINLELSAVCMSTTITTAMT